MVIAGCCPQKMCYLISLRCAFELKISCNLHSNGNGKVEQLKANLEVENSPAKFLSVNGHVTLVAWKLFPKRCKQRIGEGEMSAN